MGKGAAITLCVDGKKVGEGVKTMVSAAGLEPATHALKGHCSTN
jgi:hypothetical protein